MACVSSQVPGHCVQEVPACSAAGDTPTTSPAVLHAVLQSTPDSADRRPVICLGDSHTRGFYGASWLNLLRPQFPQLRFINAGHDGEPSESIAARLPALLEAHPNPAAVLLFSGSNDCIAQENEQLQAWYKSLFRLTQPCSKRYALDNLERMLALVQDKAPAAKVSACWRRTDCSCQCAQCNRRCGVVFVCIWGPRRADAGCTG